MSLLEKYLKERSIQGTNAKAEGHCAKTEPKEKSTTIHDTKVVHNTPISNFEQQLRIFDLEQESLPVGFNNISYVPNAVSESCGEKIVDCINSGIYEWTHLKTRKLLYFGGIPEKDRKREDLPNWLTDISSVLVERKIFPPSLAPNHVLINQYQPGEGIMHHTDGPLYHDGVVILSFGFPALMSFRRRLTSEQIGRLNVKDNDMAIIDEGGTSSESCVNILLRPNSLLYFSNEAYTSFLHGIDTWDSALCSLGGEISDAFNCYVSSLDNVIDKHGDPSNVGCIDACAKNIMDSNCVRTSLTIRHMF